MNQSIDMHASTHDFQSKTSNDFIENIVFSKTTMKTILNKCKIILYKNSYELTNFLVDVFQNDLYS